MGKLQVGKHTTICGDGGSTPGMIQHSFLDIWKKIQEDKKSSYSCRLSYVEIYNEKVVDLLSDKSQRIVTLQTVSSDEVVMLAADTKEPIGVEVHSYDETIAYYNKGLINKSIAATNVNERSSRSHTILSFDIEKSTNVINLTEKHQN